MIMLKLLTLLSFRLRIPLGDAGKRALVIGLHIWDANRNANAFLLLHVFTRKQRLSTMPWERDRWVDVSDFFYRTYGLYYPDWLLRRWGAFAQPDNCVVAAGIIRETLRKRNERLKGDW